jgi:hypothetical protein
VDRHVDFFREKFIQVAKLGPKKRNGNVEKKTYRRENYKAIDWLRKRCVFSPQQLIDGVPSLITAPNRNK